ncbi:WD40 repeat domain-containing protein [Deinococcus frigens]|uniref:WD40 repeat domain-containing protein n=1 Tax=Deinococcus frigens TaxID=249403 RepID=UPI00068B1557|nr:WD40 repeat domain-containing protein [Deinococcus frigens]
MNRPTLLFAALLCGQSLLSVSALSLPPIQASIVQTSATLSELRPSRIWQVSRTYAGALAYSPDGEWLVTGSGEGLIQWWPVGGGSRQMRKAQMGQAQIEKRGPSLRQPGAVTALVFNPSGSRLAATSGDGRVRVWDANSRTPLLTLDPQTYHVTALAFSPDGLTLATAGGDNSGQASAANSVKLWDLATGRVQGSLRGHGDVVTSLAFDPAGRTLASGSRDRTVRLWDVAQRLPLRTLSGHGDYVSAVTFSPDGTTLASGSWDSTVRLWTVQTGDLQRELLSQGGPVDAVAFSPEGQRLLSGAEDGRARLWNAQSGELLATLGGHSDGVKALAFSPDGTAAAAAGGRDRRVLLWTLAAHPR